MLLEINNMTYEIRNGEYQLLMLYIVSSNIETKEVRETKY